MKILLLGSNGVIGNGIYSSLINKKITRLNSEGYNHKLNKYRLSKFEKCDYFIHAAGVTEEEIKKYGSKNAIKRATKSTVELLQFIVKRGCKNIIYISTLRLYSEKSFNLSEKKTRLLIDDNYKLCHFKTENIFKKISKKHKINYLILRPGAVYGFPFKKKKFNRLKLIPYSFPIELYFKNKIVLKSSGAQMRNFCYNQDIGKKILYWIKDKNRNNTISNVSGDLTISVKGFAYLCLKTFQHIFKKRGQIIIPNNIKKKLIKRKLYVNEVIKTKNSGNIEKFLKNFFVLLKKKKIKQIILS